MVVIMRGADRDRHRRRPSGTVSTSKRSTRGASLGGFQANDGRRLTSWEVEKKWLPSVPAPLSFSNHRCSGIYDAPVI